MKKFMILGLVALITFSCGDFLEERSQDLVYASSCEDLNEILIGNAYMDNDIGVQYFLYSSSGNYYPWLWVMDDDMEAYTNAGLGGMSGQQLAGFYQWKESPFVLYGNPLDDYEWERLYKHIAVTNVVVDQVNEFPDDPEELRNKVKGEALFLRAAYYFLLANMYAAPYEKDKANNTPGVPLKLTSYIEDLKFKRTRLDTLYSSIIHDLKESAICLEKINEDQVFKANAHAANLLLSRVYLYMGEWEEALKSCEKVSNRLYHLEKLSLPYSQNFFRVSCPELIFAQGSECAANIFGALGGYCFRVSDGLIGLYQSDDKYKDLRASIFLKSKSSRMVSGKISSLFGSYIAEGDTPDTFVLRYAEVLLNKAEALVMLDREDEAIDVLKELLETRYENGIYPEITERGEDLVNLIRDERRRELCFEGHRWFDLRRYAVNPKYPLTDYKIIHGVYAEKPESGQAAQIGYCVLEMYPKGKGWILPIPEYEVNVNPEIGHNEREDAEYVEF